MREGIYAGHDPNNLMQLPHAVHKSVTKLWNDKIGKSGKLFFERDKDGLFKINHWRNACRQAEQINKISEFYDGYKRRAFVFAMIHLLNHDSCDFNQLLRKIKLKRAEMFDCTNTEQYVILLNKIYNHGQSKKVSLIYN